MSDETFLRLRAAFRQEPPPAWEPRTGPDADLILIDEASEHLATANGTTPAQARRTMGEVFEAMHAGAELLAQFEEASRRLLAQTRPRIVVDGVVHDLTPPTRSWPTFVEDPYPEVRAVAKKHLPTEREALAAQVARIFDIPRRMVDGQP